MKIAKFFVLTVALRAQAQNTQASCADARQDNAIHRERQPAARHIVVIRIKHLHGTPLLPLAAAASTRGN